MKVGIFHIILTQEQKDYVKSTELRFCLMGRVKGCKYILGRYVKGQGSRPSLIHVP